MHDFHFFGGGWMMLFWVVLFIVIILLIVRILMSSDKDHTGDTALETLKKRYARGEIDKEEFEKRKKDLLE
ncbi:MAG: SHOCT domain-containing protein [Bacteroidota bacterium]